MHKEQDIVIYRDERFYATFPSIVRRANGELLVAFRRAPERRWHGGRPTHADPNSQIALVRSADDGESWSDDVQIIHAHAMGGSQDPCLTLLPDDQLLCTSYLSILQQPRSAAGVEHDYTGWKCAAAGGYLMRSPDGGQSWHGPILPPPIPGDQAVGPGNVPKPAFNRGNILLGSDGLLYWAVARSDRVHLGPGTGGFTSVHLMVSEDAGTTWDYRCPIAQDDHVAFNETYLYETAAGDLVAFLRTADPDRQVTNAIARSTDRGRSFSPWHPLAFSGHPHCVARLTDGRVLLVYGYRQPPYGVRARILDADCTIIEQATELILRDDGGSPDLGYPWVTVLPDGRALVVYYHNDGSDNRFDGIVPEEEGGMTAHGGLRYIAATWLTP